MFWLFFPCLPTTFFGESTGESTAVGALKWKKKHFFELRGRPQGVSESAGNLSI